MEDIQITEVTAYNPVYVPRINELLLQLTTGACFTEQDLKDIVASPGSHLFLLFYNGMIAGMLSVGSYQTPTGPKYWVEDVVVDNCYRGKSFGKKLIMHAIDYVSKQKEATLMLTSNPSRVAANKLYQSVGFQQKLTNVYKMLFKSNS
jgi:ribosomal protein S18 acetylase RimI-like enzyme